MKIILQNNISNVGLDIGIDTQEYPYWAISKYKMNHPIYLEHLGVDNPSKAFKNKVFVPDMVISTNHQNDKVIFLGEMKYLIGEKMADISLFFPSNISER